jgi:hypothetical protein
LSPLWPLLAAQGQPEAGRLKEIRVGEDVEFFFALFVIPSRD